MKTISLIGESNPRIFYQSLDWPGGWGRKQEYCTKCCMGSFGSLPCKPGAISCSPAQSIQKFPPVLLSGEAVLQNPVTQSHLTHIATYSLKTCYCIQQPSLSPFQKTLTFMANDFRFRQLWSLPLSDSSSLSIFSVVTPTAPTVAAGTDSSSSATSLPPPPPPPMGSISATSLSEELTGCWRWRRAVETSCWEFHKELKG